ncbi:MAG TPA: AAA family ATPase [Tepidisphaeraceae bacterium]|jgi:capsular exopolysaccharide synthesis family protein
MNNQMITHAQRTTPPGAIDVWGGGNGQNTQLGFNQPQPPAGATPADKVSRLLRGRVALAIVLAVLGGIIGGTAGAMLQNPTYKASGRIQIQPTIILVEGDRQMPYYMQFMTTQAQTLTSPQIVGNLSKHEPWKSAFGDNQDALITFVTGLKAEYIKNSFNIDVSCVSDDPKIATAGIQSLIESFRSSYKDLSDDNLNRRINALVVECQNLQFKKDNAEKLINDLVGKYGAADLEPLVASAQQTVDEVKRDLRVHQNNMNAATQAAQGMRDTNGKIPIEELAQVDPAMAQQLTELKNIQNNLATLERRLGNNHPKVATAREDVAAAQRQIEEYANVLRKDVIAIIPDFGRPNGVLKVSQGMLRVMDARIAQRTSDRDAAEKERATLAVDAGNVATARTTIRNATDDLADRTKVLDSLRFQQVTTGKLDVMQNGQFADRQSNKKILFGLAGAVGGAGLAVGVLLAIAGLVDTRFRYSDDAAGNSMSGIPLLGILPNLPDKLTDPAQASVAAHCVHQIRTMLQLNAMREACTVFAITSASSGDGKTSLSLALGLSFAASGSRTLLIDADLVGGGLSSRLGNNSSIGIVDAISGTKIDDVVQATDVADLAIIPIGSAQAHHAGSFSPPAVRRFLAEARKHFEVIVVDTGPVMGSIEATPICASVDGVVLTVARGQSRPLVERAISHLSSIGAKVAGVVFNRAQHKDFEQSIGAISIRSAGRSTMNGTNHNARNPGEMGAVAQAVASSVRNEN